MDNKKTVINIKNLIGHMNIENKSKLCDEIENVKKKIEERIFSIEKGTTTNLDNLIDEVNI